MKNQNLATKIFQRYIKDKDIRKFKKSIFYYLFYRCLRSFFNVPLIVKIYNFYLLSNNRKNKASYSILQKCDFFDVSEINFIKKISREFKIFLIDCGSNFGFYSLFVSSLSSSNEVISLEASQETLNEFKDNLSLNNFKNIKYLNRAVFHKDDQKVVFNESEKDWESSLLISNYKIKNSVSVKTITIDKIFQNESLKGKILIFKIDVEGNDLNVLAGARKTIRNFNPIIIIEFSKYILFNHDYNYDFLKKFLEENDYQIYNNKGKIMSVDNILEEINQLDENHDTIGNYYLIKKDKDIIKKFF